MSLNVFEAVGEIVAGLHSIDFALEHDLVNLSALARFIQPMVADKVGFDVGQDAIVIALRKVASEQSFPGSAVFDFLKGGKLVLRTGLSALYFRRSEELYRKLIDFQQNIDWSAGEKMYILQRSEELSVVVISRHADEVVSFSSPVELLARRDNLAMLTVSPSTGGLEAFGVVEFLARQFTDCGVSIVEVFSSLTKISFIFPEEKASEVYERVSNAIETSGKVTEKKG